MLSGPRACWRARCARTSCTHNTPQRRDTLAPLASNASAFCRHVVHIVVVEDFDDLGRVAPFKQRCFRRDGIPDETGDDFLHVTDGSRGGRKDLAEVAHELAEQHTGRVYGWLSLLVARPGLAGGEINHEELVPPQRFQQADGHVDVRLSDKLRAHLEGGAVQSAPEQFYTSKLYVTIHG